jgi:hypothetical protein
MVFIELIKLKRIKEKGERLKVKGKRHKDKGWEAWKPGGWEVGRPKSKLDTLSCITISVRPSSSRLKTAPTIKV